MSGGFAFRRRGLCLGRGFKYGYLRFLEASGETSHRNDASRERWSLTRLFFARWFSCQGSDSRVKWRYRAFALLECSGSYLGLQPGADDGSHSAEDVEDDGKRYRNERADTCDFRGFRLRVLPDEEQDEADDGEQEPENAPADAAAVVNGLRRRAVHGLRLSIRLLSGLLPIGLVRLLSVGLLCGLTV